MYYCERGMHLVVEYETRGVDTDLFNGAFKLPAVNVVTYLSYKRGRFTQPFHHCKDVARRSARVGFPNGVALLAHTVFGEVYQ